jgi:hypothetical protein
MCKRKEKGEGRKKEIKKEEQTPRRHREHGEIRWRNHR